MADLAAGAEAAAAQVALAWLLDKSAVTAPIVGATKDRHVDDAVAAVGVRLSEKELASLAEPYTAREVRF